jgi:predicted secreted protein
MKLMKKLYLVLFVLLNFSICYCQNDTIFVTGDIPILKVKANEPFVLKFLACHDCGYNWSLEKADSSYVKLISLSSRNTSGRNNIEGGNVYEFWKFTVVSAGTYVLEFIYKRPWLKEVEKVFNVELHVN